MGGVARPGPSRDVALDGRPVAAKLQYPDMASALEADLNQLKLVFAVGQRFDPAIRTEEIHAEIIVAAARGARLRREARHVALYRHMLRDEAAVHVPEVVGELSTDRLLTMTWLAGEPLLNWKTRPHEERDALAVNMFRAWYVPFYFYGVIHGDPHLGNYTVRPIGRGQPDGLRLRARLPAALRGRIDRPLSRAAGRRPDLAVAAYEGWGFTGCHARSSRVLNRWAAFVYGPLMDDRARRITEGMAGVYGREMAEGVLEELRRSAACGRRGSSSSWTEPRSASARSSSTSGLDQLAPPVPGADRGIRR